jgi:hypothetical protein
MDANKLIRIISKDLEELKTLTFEIAESETDSSLIIDLALSRARLLCQEIELLKEVTVKPFIQPDETEEEVTDSEEEEEVSSVSISEPELEIINFEVQESAEKEEIDEEQEEIVYNSEEEEEEEISEEDIDEMEEEVVEEENGEDYQLPEDVELEVEDKRNVDESETDDDIDESEEEDYEEEGKIDFEDEEKFDPEEESVVEDQDDDHEQNANIEVNELNPVQQSGIREIQIEDLDEEESETIQFTPVSTPVERPVMREIPKPEILLDEKKEEDETFQKERSLNDVISENKSVETNLGNSPISSLRSSIGLNDRFLFIREIFSNNTDKYNMVIDHLDKLETIQQAVDYLKANLTLQKNDTSLKFVDLLKRRFTK